MQDRAALAEFHADGLELALLVGEFGALLLADYISVVPDEDHDSAAGRVLGDLVAVTVPEALVHAGGGERASCRPGSAARCGAGPTGDGPAEKEESSSRLPTTVSAVGRPKAR
ncbi:hypothetical protein [Streptomyces sp. NPDC059165]|uniref:hypothetical protein n=1 Tax=Streptomyces sp. NPDC059165 TaxID=3346751 RepID=UPI0036A43255